MDVGLLTDPVILFWMSRREVLILVRKRKFRNWCLISADQGMAVTFISSEVEEMLRTCTRMGVMRDGKKVGEVAGDELTQENIMKAIAGGDNNE